MRKRMVNTSTFECEFLSPGKKSWRGREREREREREK
jgi:hypothetical protein